MALLAPGLTPLSFALQHHSNKVPSQDLDVRTGMVWWTVFMPLQTGSRLPLKLLLPVREGPPADLTRGHLQARPPCSKQHHFSQHRPVLAA